MTNQKIDTLLVEDHEISRLGLKLMLEHTQNVSVVAEETNGSDAVLKAMELRPTLVIMDIGLPGLDGIEATRQIKESLSCKIILLTSHEEENDVLSGLAAGVDAYCLKGISAAQLGTAISTALAGGLWLDPGISRHVIKTMTTQTTAQSSSSNSSNKSNKSYPCLLSEREYEVLCLLVDGLSNQQMATRMYLSAETIKTHMRHLMEKLRVNDRTQAAVKAVREGLVPCAG